MHRLSVRMLHSFSRSGETMLLRALAAHPMIHVVHDLAATNTPVEQQLASRICFKGENEIPANVIGELVMQALASLDKVAYVRFASVYKNFRETRDFEALIGELEGDEKD